MGYSPRDCIDSDMTECLSLTHSLISTKRITLAAVLSIDNKNVKTEVLRKL